MVLLAGSPLVGLSSKVRVAARYRGGGGARGMDLAVVVCCPDMGGGSVGGECTAAGEQGVAWAHGQPGHGLMDSLDQAAGCALWDDVGGWRSERGGGDSWDSVGALRLRMHVVFLAVDSREAVQPEARVRALVVHAVLSSLLLSCPPGMRG